MVFIKHCQGPPDLGGLWCGGGAAAGQPLGWGRNPASAARGVFELPDYTLTPIVVSLPLSGQIGSEMNNGTAHCIFQYRFFQNR